MRCSSSRDVGQSEVQSDDVLEQDSNVAGVTFAMSEWVVIRRAFRCRRRATRPQMSDLRRPWSSQAASSWSAWPTSARCRLADPLLSELLSLAPFHHMGRKGQERTQAGGPKGDIMHLAPLALATSAAAGGADGDCFRSPPLHLVARVVQAHDLQEECDCTPIRAASPLQSWLPARSIVAAAIEGRTAVDASGQV